MELSFLPAAENLPKIGNPDRVEPYLAQWAERSKDLADRELADFADALRRGAAGQALLAAIFANSPFLSHCVLTDMSVFAAYLSKGPEAVLREVSSRLKTDLYRESDRGRLMSGLRTARRQAALVIGLADLTQLWSVDEVIKSLSHVADALVSAALAHLLRQAHERGELALPDPQAPETDCGYVILGMGKLGAEELNYSSDVDLIILFDPERARYLHARGAREGFVRLTRDLVRILDERTAEGYVCRTDLRLRPDPGAMPLAISVTSALTYYESLGQNWERAAMIKARPVAGDLRLGAEFLAELRPFVWRKHLDFWAIQDVHSIKRQIHAHKGGGAIAVKGHDVKLGRGGIREIEFFAQTQQLIWGGRDPRLREPRTCQALAALAVAGQIDAAAAEELSEAYHYLRRVEHRLQMVEDQQTHKLPADDAGLEAFAAFLGYDSRQDFERQLVTRLRAVENHYAHLFEEAPDLSGPGNLVFTGGEVEPATRATLEGMGFGDGAQVFNLVRSWHHGRYRATRSTRSRELLTEIMPALLQSLAETTQPDQALTRFDAFLAGLPAGVQLFSLLQSNPLILDLLAEIMGGAPVLAEQLSRNSGLLDAVLTPGFFERIPDRKSLAAELDTMLSQARDFEDVLDLSRRWANDRRFQAGVHILRHSSDVDESGRALSDIAETVIRGLYRPVTNEMASRHGHIPGAGLAILAMGKLGGREMTVSSDLDLVFLYDGDAAMGPSDGAKPLEPSQYFARLAQRYINALTAKTGEGQLYEIDMRLRPSGNAGPIATSLSGFAAYYQNDAWIWEHMALSRARVIAGDSAQTARIEKAIRKVLLRPRDPDALLSAVAEMRARIAQEHPAKSLWSVKYLRGGLVDLEFLAQYLQLRHAAKHPQILDASTQAAFTKLAGVGIIGPSLAGRLIEATRLMRQVQGMLRLTVGPAFDADNLPPGLQASLAKAAGLGDFADLKSKLISAASSVHEVFVETIEEPARELAGKP